MDPQSNFGFSKINMESFTKIKIYEYIMVKMDQNLLISHQQCMIFENFFQFYWLFWMIDMIINFEYFSLNIQRFRKNEIQWKKLREFAPRMCPFLIKYGPFSKNFFSFIFQFGSLFGSQNLDIFCQNSIISEKIILW